jgi:hypothetical protein
MVAAWCAADEADEADEASEADEAAGEAAVEGASTGGSDQPVAAA